MPVHQETSTSNCRPRPRSARAPTSSSAEQPQQASEALGIRPARHVRQIAVREIVGQHLMVSTLLGNPAAAGDGTVLAMRNVAGLLGLKLASGLTPAEIVRAAEAATGAFDS